jgi:phage baseplate assembly protein W
MASQGLKRAQGGLTGGWDHVVDSVTDILTTRIGTRVMRRDYGSEIPALIDQPMSDPVLLAIYTAVADAIDRWEPRLAVRRVAFMQASADGTAQIAIEAIYFPFGHLGDRATTAPIPTLTIVVT